MTGLAGFEAHRFRVLLLAMLALFVAHALEDRTDHTDLVLGPVGASVLAATLFALGGRRWVLWTALALAVAPAALPFWGGPGGFAALAGSGFHAPLFCFAAGTVTAEVIRSERADEDAVVGSICAYLFLSLAFASLYAALEGWRPGSFAFAAGPPPVERFGELAYFSLVAMTTLGYGDLTPLAPAAVSLVTLQMVVGVLFPAFVVARIVSLYTFGGGRPFHASHFGFGRIERFEWLIAAQLLLIVAAPFLVDPAKGMPLRIVLTALLLAALVAVSERHWIWWITGAFALLSVVARWWPAGAADWVPVGGLAAEVLFLGLVAVGLVRLVARERSVSRRVLMVSVALYLLLGVAWASAYSFVEALAPGSVVHSDGSPTSAADRLYFSYATLTTTGFGDILPASGPAKRLATLESFAGVFYPAVLIARLVSLYETS